SPPPPPGEEGVVCRKNKAGCSSPSSPGRAGVRWERRGWGGEGPLWRPRRKDGPLPGIRVVLLDRGEHPVEGAAGDLGAAVLAVARHVDVEGRAAVGTGLVGARRALHSGATDQRPVF